MALQSFTGAAAVVLGTWPLGTRGDSFDWMVLVCEEAGLHCCNTKL